MSCGTPSTSSSLCPRRAPVLSTARSSNDTEPMHTMWSGHGWEPSPGRAFAACAAAIGLALCGCAVDGTVTVRNSSGTEFLGTLNGFGFALSGSESIEIPVKIGTRMLFIGPDTKEVTIEGESCTRTPFSDVIRVRSGDTVVYEIEPDASCIVWRNDAQSADVTSAFRRDAGPLQGASIVEEAGTPVGTMVRHFTSPIVGAPAAVSLEFAFAIPFGGSREGSTFDVVLYAHDAASNGPGEELARRTGLVTGFLEEAPDFTIVKTGLRRVEIPAADFWAGFEPHWAGEDPEWRIMFDVDGAPPARSDRLLNDASEWVDVSTLAEYGALRNLGIRCSVAEPIWGENRFDSPLFRFTTLSERTAPGRYDFYMADDCGDTTFVFGIDAPAGSRRDIAHTGSADGSCGGF